MEDAHVPPDPTVDDADTEAEAPAGEAIDADPRLAELEDKLLRARADYENLRKRVERDGELERQRAKARAIESFLPVYEFARLAAAEAEKAPGPLADGVRMLVAEFDRALEGEGVVRVGEVGDAFDAALHEAVGEEPADGVPAGAVSRVVASGYRLGERVLRFARVMVAPEPDSPSG